MYPPGNPKYRFSMATSSFTCRHQSDSACCKFPDLVRRVGFSGSPTPMPKEDIERIPEFLGQGWRAEPRTYIRRLGEGRGECAGRSRGWKESSCGGKIVAVSCFRPP